MDEERLDQVLFYFALAMTEDQLRYQTGGPKIVDMLYSPMILAICNHIRYTHIKRGNMMEMNLRTTFQLLIRRYGTLSGKCCDNCCDSGTTLIQSDILHEIKRQHNPSMQDIAYALGIDITTFSRQVKTLIERRLVKKTPDPQDNRIQILSLTLEGEILNTELDKQVNGDLEQVLSQLSEFERKSVINALHLLEKAMLQSYICCPPPK